MFVRFNFIVNLIDLFNMRMFDFTYRIISSPKNGWSAFGIRIPSAV